MKAGVLSMFPVGWHCFGNKERTRFRRFLKWLYKLQGSGAFQTWRNRGSIRNSKSKRKTVRGRQLARCVRSEMDFESIIRSSLAQANDLNLHFLLSNS